MTLLLQELSKRPLPGAFQNLHLHNNIIEIHAFTLQRPLYNYTEKVRNFTSFKEILILLF